MERSESVIELVKALSKFQGEIKSIPKDSTNPFFKMKYASLDAIWEHIRKSLSDNGLSIVQTTYEQEGKTYLETTLFHSSGEWMRSYLDIRAKAQDPQSIGSAITYARRYSLSAILGISADEDEDGNIASGKKNGQDKPATVPQPEHATVAPTVKSQDTSNAKLDMITEAQKSKIFASGQQMGYNESDLKDILTKHFKKESTKLLTKKEASEFIEAIAAGKHINEQGELV